MRSYAHLDTLTNKGAVKKFHISTFRIMHDHLVELCSRFEDGAQLARASAQLAQLDALLSTPDSGWMDQK